MCPLLFSFLSVVTLISSIWQSGKDFITPVSAILFLYLRSNKNSLTFKTGSLSNCIVSRERKLKSIAAIYSRNRSR